MRQLSLQPSACSRRLFCLLVAFTLIIGCVHPASRSALSVDGDHSGQVWLRTELIFGRSIEGGGMVTDEEWNQFLETVVTPRFPDGFTAWDADGQWKSDTGTIITEPSNVILIVYPDNGEADRKISEIIDRYKTVFRQQAVLRMTQETDIRFE